MRARGLPVSQYIGSHIFGICFNSSSATPSLFEQDMDADGMQAVVEEYKHYKAEYQPPNSLNYLRDQRELKLALKERADSMVRRAEPNIARAVRSGRLT